MGKVADKVLEFQSLIGRLKTDWVNSRLHSKKDVSIPYR